MIRAIQTAPRVPTPDELPSGRPKAFFEAVCHYCEADDRPAAILGPCGHVLCVNHAPAPCRPRVPHATRIVVTELAECPLCGVNVTLALWSGPVPVVDFEALWARCPAGPDRRRCVLEALRRVDPATVGAFVRRISGRALYEPVKPRSADQIMPGEWRELFRELGASAAEIQDALRRL